MRLRRRQTRMGPPVGTPVVLRENRVRLVLLMVCSAVLFAAGLGNLVPGGRSVWAWAAAIGFGVCTVVFVWLLTPGGRTLALDDDGLVATIGLPGRRPIRVAWKDVARFSIVRTSGQTMIGLHLRPGAPALGRPFWRKLNGVLIADVPDGFVPTLYGGLSASELVKLLQRWQGHAANVRGHAKTASGREQAAS